MLRVALVTIMAREMRSKVFWSRRSFGDVASGASHDIGARNAIESFFNYIWCQTANNVTSRARKISLKFVEKNFWCQFSIAYIAPISWLAVFAAPPRLVLLKTFQSHFSRQLRDLRHLHNTVSEDCMFQSHTPRTNRSWQKRPCSQSHVKHVSVSTAMAFKASDRRHHAVEIICNPVSSYFHSQVFIFMRLSSLALPWIAIFARKCDCHAMVNSLAIARIAISTRNLRLSSLRLHEKLYWQPHSVWCLNFYFVYQHKFVHYFD